MTMGFERLRQLKEIYDRTKGGNEDEYMIALGGGIDDSDPKKIAELALNPETAGVLKDYLEIYCFPEFREIVESEIEKLKQERGEEGILETQVSEQSQPSCTERPRKSVYPYSTPSIESRDPVRFWGRTWAQDRK